MGDIEIYICRGRIQQEEISKDVGRPGSKARRERSSPVSDREERPDREHHKVYRDNFNSGELQKTSLEMEKSKEDDPLFVRVDGYKEILQDFEAIRQILINMREATTVLQQLERVKEQSIDAFLENLKRLNERLSSVDREFPNLGDGTNIESQVREVSGKKDTESLVDDSINDLHSELEGLKNELEKIE